MSSSRLLQKTMGVVTVFVDFIASATTNIVFLFFLIRDAALSYSFDIITDIHEQFNRTLKPVTRFVPQTHRLHQQERDLH